MAKELAIICNNGSLNSLVATGLAAQKFRPILLHIETTNDPDVRVRAAFDLQVAHFKPYREHVISLPRTTARPASTALADPRVAPPLVGQMLDLLPIMAVAARFADQYRAKAIYTGVRAGVENDDLAKATEYFQIWQELISHPCGLAEIELHNPLLELEPWQVIDVGAQIGTPFDKSWSCTEGGAEPCRACRGCSARDAAFIRAAKADPLLASVKA